MPEQWRVLKFGGTSVAGLSQWETIAELTAQHRREGHRVLLVCSAIAGVTDMLEALVHSDSDFDADEDIRATLAIHERLATSAGVDASAVLSEAGNRLTGILQDHHSAPGPRNRAKLLAMGEWMSTRLGQLILARDIDCEWVDAREALEAVPEADPDSARAWLSARCESKPDQELTERWSGRAPVLITQGYVACNDGGQTTLLGRGGSDTSAALLAGRLSAPEVEIWTDVPGLFSADPDLEPEAVLLDELDYAEALEMAASGARVVHPRCIRAAADSDISIVVRDLSRPELLGTKISGGQSVIGEAAQVPGVKAVTYQDRMLVILLENLDTRQQVGFLAWVFDIFSRYGISIDLVATSETTTTLAINSLDNHLDRELLASISSKLSDRCRVKVFQDCCCVNLVGRGARTALSKISPAAESFNEWPLLMLSQSANDMCLSMLVFPQHAVMLLRELHQCLIGSPGT